MPTTQRPQLTEEQVEQLGVELDAIRARLVADLGESDAAYIRKIIRTQRGLEIAGRLLLQFGWLPPAWVGGTAALSLSKILDNMEIGHNVMHGQYDWMKDPALDGHTFEWDSACPGDQWRHSHNYMHHTYTNIMGQDRDLGYGVVRISEDQRWNPYYLANLVYASVLMLLFEWGVALHDVELDRVAAGEVKLSSKFGMLKEVGRKGGRQMLKDYVVFPLLAGPGAPFTLAGNVTANVVRNVWAYMIIFCGHFPEGVEEFTPEEAANETRGGWYVRQMIGSANISGGPLLHLLSGNLSYQIEHHLYPDIPSVRYSQISGEVREICDRYGLPYNTGPLHKQFGSVVKKIARLSLPWVGNAPLNRNYRGPQPAGVVSGAGASAPAEPAREPEPELALA